MKMKCVGAMLATSLACIAGMVMFTHSRYWYLPSKCQLGLDLDGEAGFQIKMATWIAVVF